MNILTLITDWNNDDYFIAAVKGYLLSNNIDLQLVEITHKIPLFDSQKAAFIQKATLGQFPEESMHINGVRGVNSGKVAAPVIVRYLDSWFAGYDSNAFMSIFDHSHNPQAWHLPCFDTPFPELDLLIKPTIELLQGKNIDSIGSKIDKMPVIAALRPEILPQSMVGTVIYINGYGNAVTNITREMFSNFTAGRQVAITVLKRQNLITEISKTIDKPEGELFAMFNSLGLLELGQVNYRLDESIGVSIMSKIRIQLI